MRARVLNAIQETGYLSPKEAHRQAAEAKLPFKPVRLGVLCQTGAVRSTRMSREAFRLRVLSWKSAMLRCVCTCETDIPRETIELLDELVNWGAQGIALCALNDISIEARIGELAEQGIPCITFNSICRTAAVREAGQTHTRPMRRQRAETPAMRYTKQMLSASIQRKGFSADETRRLITTVWHRAAVRPPAASYGKPQGCVTHAGS